MCEQESFRIPGLTLRTVEWAELSDQPQLQKEDFIDIISKPDDILAIRSHLEPGLLNTIDLAYERRLMELWKLTPDNGEWHNFHSTRMQQNDGVMVWNRLTREWKRTLKEEEYRKVFRSRIDRLYTPVEAENMRDSVGVFLGMSTGSEVLKTLLQEGLEHFIASDPDFIDLSNITRLSDATDDDVGRNKAVFMGNVALKINPYIQFKIFPRKLNSQEIKEVVSEGRYVIEMIDGIDQKIEVRDLVQEVANESKRAIPVITGTNLFDAPLITVDTMSPVHGRENYKPTYFQNPDLTDEDLLVLRSKPRTDITQEEKILDFIQKTAKAIKLIGRENIPDRHMVSFILAARGKMSFWSQRGSDAKMVGVLIEQQIRKLMKGLQMDPKVRFSTQMQYPDGDSDFFRNLCEIYPDIFGQYSTLSEAISSEYSRIFSKFT